jgi:hypothetical protein
MTRFKAAVPGAGMSDLASEFGTEMLESDPLGGLGRAPRERGRRLLGNGRSRGYHCRSSLAAAMAAVDGSMSDSAQEGDHE